jgi:hypothetical protein
MEPQPSKEQCAPTEGTPEVNIQGSYRGTIEFSEGLNWSLGHPPFLWESGDFPGTDEAQSTD